MARTGPSPSPVLGAATSRHPAHTADCLFSIKSRAGIRVVSFPAAILPELMHHLKTFAAPGLDGLVFPNEHGQPFLRGNCNKAVPWSDIAAELGVPALHLHDLRHTGNTLAAQSGASLRDLMVGWGMTHQRLR